MDDDSTFVFDRSTLNDADLRAANGFDDDAVIDPDFVIEEPEAGYGQGYGFAVVGKPMSACPYAPGDPAGAEWRRGWIDGEGVKRERAGTFDHSREFYDDLAEAEGRDRLTVRVNDPVIAILGGYDDDCTAELYGNRCELRAPHTSWHRTLRQQQPGEMEWRSHDDERTSPISAHPPPGAAFVRKPNSPMRLAVIDQERFDAWQELRRSEMVEAMARISRALEVPIDLFVKEFVALATPAIDAVNDAMRSMVPVFARISDMMGVVVGPEPKNAPMSPRERERQLLDRRRRSHRRTNRWGPPPGGRH